ncbi:MAG: hypothetical protein NZ988_00990 [Thaumarchaeota archaeon]|nr:hypothetical protein [Candidatus Calditenuaceae archaeon]MDW8186609.1 hypothetical protein [Nitrososphaerota archaeon]
MTYAGYRIVTTKRNELLKRTEYLIEVNNEAGTPSRSQLRELLTTALNAKSERLLVVKVWSPAGKTASRVIARVYDGRDDLMRVEPKFLLIREGLLERPKKS